MFRFKFRKFAKTLTRASSIARYSLVVRRQVFFSLKFYGFLFLMQKIEYNQDQPTLTKDTIRNIFSAFFLSQVAFNRNSAECVD